MKADHERLLNRALRAFGDVSPTDAIQKTRAIIGPGKIPDSETAALNAMKKLKDGKSPSAQELLALEFVIRIMRPAPLSHGGMLDPLDMGDGNFHPPATVQLWDDFRTKVQPLLSSVGRIDYRGNHIGTGFLVKSNVLATNRHVLDLLSGGAGILPPDGVRVLFNHEYGASESEATKADIIAVLDVHPKLDIALFEIKGTADRPPLPLDLTVSATDGDPVVVVGFPAESRGSNPIFADAVFKGQYGVRRGSLGEVMDTADPLFYHDCTTLGGNSGSPVFSLLSHKVIGIHRSGFFTYRNEGVVAREIQTLLPN
jgi:trypsin-like peptidase